MEAPFAALSLWCLPCRYDDLKSAQDNIDLQTTILSRFDLIFIVKDERSMDRDKMIARHVLEVHRMAGQQQDHGEQERRVGAGCLGLLAGCTMTSRSWHAHCVYAPGIWRCAGRSAAVQQGAGRQQDLQSGFQALVVSFGSARGGYMLRAAPPALQACRGRSRSMPQSQEILIMS